MGMIAHRIAIAIRAIVVTLRKLVICPKPLDHELRYRGPERNPTAAKSSTRPWFLS
jgi:hypothetical protein